VLCLVFLYKMYSLYGMYLQYLSNSTSIKESFDVKNYHLNMVWLHEEEEKKKILMKFKDKRQGSAKGMDLSES